MGPAARAPVSPRPLEPHPHLRQRVPPRGDHEVGHVATAGVVVEGLRESGVFLEEQPLVCGIEGEPEAAQDIHAEQARVARV